MCLVEYSSVYHIHIFSGVQIDEAWGLTYLDLNKMADISTDISKKHFLRRKILYSDSNSIDVCW